MKVAYFVYPSAFQNKGGGEIVLEKTEEYVKKEGVEVKRFDMWNDKISDFDVLHVFGSVKDCLGLMRVAKVKNVAVVIHSIFWSDFRRAVFEAGNAREKLEKVARHAAKLLFPFFPSSRKKMFDLSDLIFSNSKNESDQISRLFAIPAEKMFVVPNGVDTSFALADKKPFVEKYGLEDFILCVGRIEPRKNQLNLIRAVSGMAKKLVIIGETVAGYEWYRARCLKEAGDNVVFLGGISHSSQLLASGYAACDTFVLPGWFETPGLAALEAALAGAKVVVTEGGSTREYFGDRVLYVKPDCVRDIRRKIERSLSMPKRTDLKKFVLDSYTWTKVARRTVEGYKKALGGFE